MPTISSPCTPLARSHSHLCVHSIRSQVRFGKDDGRLEGLGDARQICVKAGDLVLWDSRLVHASQPADPSAPLPLEDDDEYGKKRPRVARAACMICMVPAESHLRAKPQLGARRVYLIEQGCTTTHWPQEESAIASNGPPGSGVGGMHGLSAEARALVLGEPCERRAAYGRQV